MKVKVSTASAPVLDWMVAKARGITDVGQPAHLSFDVEWMLMHEAGDMNYSTDWSQGGPIIERERMTIEGHNKDWRAIKYHDDLPWTKIEGPTPLIAAMRCYVVSKLGEEVDVPEELI